MNYIREINAFRDFQFMHKLPASAVATWHALMTINNAAGWKRTFNAANSTVQSLAGLSKQGLANAREILVEHRLIYYQKGTRGSAPVYQIVSLANQNVNTENPFLNESSARTVALSVERNVDLSVDQSLDPSEMNDLVVDLSVDQPVDEKLTIPKHKLKQKRGRGRGMVKHNPFLMYELNIGELRPIVKESLTAWCQKLGNEIVIEGIRQAATRGGKTFSYLDKILNHWASVGLKTVDDVRAHEDQKAVQRQKPAYFQTTIQREIPTLFDELRREGSMS